MSTEPDNSIDLIPADDETRRPAPRPVREDLEFDLPAPIALDGDNGPADASRTVSPPMPPREAVPTDNLSVEDLFEDIGLSEDAVVIAPTSLEAAGEDPTSPAPAGGDDATEAESLSAADLFDHDDQSQAPEQAAPAEPQPWTEADQALIEHRIEAMDRARGVVLELYKKAGEDQNATKDYERARDDGRQLLEQCSDLIDALSEREEAKDPRQALVDCYFRLQRAVEHGTKAGVTGYYETLAERAKHKEAEAAAARELARRAGAAAKGPFRLGRAAKLGILLAVLAGGRAAFYFGVEAQDAEIPEVKLAQPPEEVGIITDFNEEHPAKGSSSDLAIQTIVFTQSPEGLRAKVICGTKDFKDLSLLKFTYTWFENDQILAVGPSDALPASKLKAKATYYVEVTAKVGGKSATASSKKLVFAAEYAKQGKEK